MKIRLFTSTVIPQIIINKEKNEKDPSITGSTKAFSNIDTLIYNHFNNTYRYIHFLEKVEESIFVLSKQGKPASSFSICL